MLDFRALLAFFAFFFAFFLTAFFAFGQPVTAIGEIGRAHV